MGKVDEQVKHDAYRRFLRGETNEDIARELGVGVATVYNWARNEGWRDHRDRTWEKARDKIQRQATSDIVAESKKMLGLVRASLAIYAKNCKAELVNPTNPRDLKSLIECFQLLTGGPTAIIKSDVALSPYDQFLNMRGSELLDAITAETAGNGSEPPERR